MEAENTFLIDHDVKWTLQVLVGAPQTPGLAAIGRRPQLHLGHTRWAHGIDVVRKLETRGTRHLRAFPGRYLRGDGDGGCLGGRC